MKWWIKLDPLSQSLIIAVLFILAILMVLAS